MKIVEFDDHARPQGQGDPNSWKSRTSPYPSFDKTKDATDGGEGASSMTPLEALASFARAQRSADAMPVPALVAAARAGPIKILEFNTGPGSSLAKATAQGGQGSDIKAVNARTIKPVLPGDKAGVNAPIKIVEFGNDQARAAQRVASVNRTGIKIVEYGDHTAKGK